MNAFDKILASLHDAQLGATTWRDTSALIDDAVGMAGTHLVILDELQRPAAPHQRPARFERAHGRTQIRTPCAELYNQVDADQARAHLASSNYAGEKVIIQTIANNQSHVRVGLSIAEQLQSVGINAEMVQYDVQTWVAKRRDPNALSIYTSAGYWIDRALPPQAATAPVPGTAAPRAASAARRGNGACGATSGGA